jgi:hypothetical protein
LKEGKDQANNFSSMKFSRLSYSSARTWEKSLNAEQLSNIERLKSIRQERFERDKSLMELCAKNAYGELGGIASPYRPSDSEFFMTRDGQTESCSLDHLQPNNLCKFKHHDGWFGWTSWNIRSLQIPALLDPHNKSEQATF